MTSAFLQDELGDYIYADPQSDLDYSITCWLEGLIFLGATWSISPAGPVIYNTSINVAPVVIGGVTYAIGKVASAFIKTFTLGQEYVVTVQGSFTGSRIDDRSFRLKCKQL